MSRLKGYKSTVPSKAFPDQPEGDITHPQPLRQMSKTTAKRDTASFHCKEVKPATRLKVGSNIANPSRLPAIQPSRRTTPGAPPHSGGTAMQRYTLQARSHAGPIRAPDQP